MRVIKYNVELGECGRNVLVKEESANYPEYSSRQALIAPSMIADFANKVFGANRKAEEYLWLLAFDNKMHLIGTFNVSHGTVCTSFMGGREIFTRLLLCGAACGVLIHNHPSGDSTPSLEDINSTTKVQELGKMLGCNIVDHIIVGSDDTYRSLKEMNLM